MNVFISGGCKNGKSYYAQTIAKEYAEKHNLPLYYIATMIPRDDEDLDRIARHLKEREGWGFETLEQPVRLTDLLYKDSVKCEGVFLMDSVTALLSNEMFDSQGNFDSDAAYRVKNDVVSFAKGTGNTIFVSDYIYGDAQEYDELTCQYMKGLAEADRALAEVCDRVIEVSFGNVEEWKK